MSPSFLMASNNNQTRPLSTIQLCHNDFSACSLSCHSATIARCCYIPPCNKVAKGCAIMRIYSESRQEATGHPNDKIQSFTSLDFFTASTIKHSMKVNILLLLISLMWHSHRRVNNAIDSSSPPSYTELVVKLVDVLRLKRM